MTENEQQEAQENPYVLAMCARMLIYYHLGLNYVDTEEFSEGERHLDQALGLVNQLSDPLKMRYITVVQDVYNNLGIINSNRDNHKKGLPLFAKAEQIYEFAKDQEGAPSAINRIQKSYLQNTSSADEKTP